jgi:hypothetical protein
LVWNDHPDDLTNLAGRGFDRPDRHNGVMGDAAGLLHIAVGRLPNRLGLTRAFGGLANRGCNLVEGGGGLLKTGRLLLGAI